MDKKERIVVRIRRGGSNGLGYLGNVARRSLHQCHRILLIVSLDAHGWGGI
ncbi:napC/NirT cytochrome c -containing domain protein [Citrobacter freundii]|nr:napC/NirT cytochrome c -containing domain protein [Citrobacter freundii]